MKYPKINEAAKVESKHNYPDGAMYLTPANAEAIENALNAAPAAEPNSEVQAVTAQLETANANLNNAQSHIANIEAQNATLQARVTELENLPAENSTKPEGNDSAHDTNQPDADDLLINNPNYSWNQRAEKLGL